MATITTSETVEAKVSGGTVRFLFRYVLDNGEVHLRKAWVPAGTDEATERSARATVMLEELAAAEAEQLIGGG